MTKQFYPERQISWKWLVLILATAFTLRLAWWLHDAPIVSIDGSEYLCAARNLIRGHGYVGCYEGPELMYTPMYSLLIAAVSLVVRDFELSAHLVSLVLGTCLVLPVFFIASLVYGRRTAYISAVLVAFHPVLVKLGGSTYNEGVYLTLLMAGIYYGLRILDAGTPRYYILTGVCFGIASLTRPEAFAYPLFFSLVIWTATFMHNRKITSTVVAAVLLLGSFALVVLPYATFLYAHTGQLRLEGKWNINYTIGSRLQAGMDYAQASYGVGTSIKASGPLLNPSEFAAFTPFHHGLYDKVRYMLRAAVTNRFDVYNQFGSYMMGDPVIFILVIIGLFRKAWSPHRLQREFVLLTMALSILILMLTAQHVEHRYAFPLIPLLILWSAKGIEELGQWTRTLGAASKLKALPLDVVPRSVQVAVVTITLAVALYGSSALVEFRSESGANLPTRQAALWLRNYWPGPKRVATWDARVAWYADGSYLQLPDADPSTTLRYIDSQRPDFIYIGEHYAKPDRTMMEWLDHGIPDSRAQLVYESKTANDRIWIYRWLPEDSKNSTNERHPVAPRKELHPPRV